VSGAHPLPSCRTSTLNPPRLTSRRSQPPLALAVPLSRFTSRVGGGSAFYVRLLHFYEKHTPHPIIGLASLRLFKDAGDFGTSSERPYRGWHGRCMELWHCFTRHEARWHFS